MDSSCNYHKLIQEVEAAIEHEQLILPSTPDTLVRVRQLLNDPDTSTEQLASLIATDTALAARILKVANSVIYKTHKGIDNLQQAISRLGQKLIETLITSHTIMQLFAQDTVSRDDPITRLLQEVQNRSIHVARLSYAIACHSKQLSADDALLAGLIHDIGYLPLLQILNKSKKLNGMNKDVSRFLKHCHPQVGAKILHSWKFPDIFIDVAKQHEQLDRKNRENADLVDVVIIANLLLHESKRPEEDISNIKVRVSAYTRLNLSTGCTTFDFDEHIETATQLLPA